MKKKRLQEVPKKNAQKHSMQCAIVQFATNDVVWVTKTRNLQPGERGRWRRSRRAEGGGVNKKKGILLLLSLSLFFSRTDASSSPLPPSFLAWHLTRGGEGGGGGGEGGGGGGGVRSLLAPADDDDEEEDDSPFLLTSCCTGRKDLQCEPCKKSFSLLSEKKSDFLENLCGSFDPQLPSPLWWQTGGGA